VGSLYQALLPAQITDLRPAKINHSLCLQLRTSILTFHHDFVFLPEVRILYLVRASQLVVHFARVFVHSKPATRLLRLIRKVWLSGARVLDVDVSAYKMKRCSAVMDEEDAVMGYHSTMQEEAAKRIKNHRPGRILNSAKASGKCKKL